MIIVFAIVVADVVDFAMIVVVFLLLRVAY